LYGVTLGQLRISVQAGGRPGRPGLPDGICERVVHPSIVVFYRLHAEARTVEILRVKHTA